MPNKCAAFGCSTGYNLENQDDLSAAEEAIPTFDFLWPLKTALEVN